jgi:hypothetical protein
MRAVHNGSFGDMFAVHTAALCQYLVTKLILINA